MSNSKHQSKIVMIYETHGGIKVDKAGKDYILEGTLAKLGVENGNGRIYEEKEYLPHLEYLNKKIKKGNLVGELDHPEKFDISLQKISHIIENIEYNKDKRLVTGKIRLLNTDAGRNAKAMIDDGVTLSISSRAAGVVGENKKVQIKKIFTYDLVADPGFEEAQLSLMNDSLDIPLDSNIKIFEVNNLTAEMLEWLVEADNEANNLQNDENKNILTEMDNKDKDKSSNYATVDQVERYSALIKEKIESFEKILEEKDEEINSLKEQIEKHEKYSDYLAEKLEEKGESIISINEQVENVIKYSDYIAENTKNVIEFTDYLAENTQNLVEFTDYITENLQESINETANVVKFVDYIGEKANEAINYSEYLAENLDTVGAHTDYISENVNDIVNYSNYLSEKIDSNISYSEYLAENLESGTTTSTKTAQNVERGNHNLSEKIDSILEQAKKQNANSLSSKTGFFGFNLLNETKQREFINLDEDQKQRIAKSVNENKPVTEQHFLQLWEEAMNPNKLETIYENILTEMPAEYRNVWNSLDESVKTNLMQQASMYKLTTPYQIRNFWQTRPILNQTTQLQKLNEEVTADKIKGTEDSSLNESKNLLNAFTGYNADHIASIKNALGSKKY